MSLVTVTTGQTIAASHVNQLVNVLQKSSGNTEVGKYVIAAGIYTSNASTTYYYASLSRGTSPVSVAIDHADIAFSQCSSVNTADLTANGFQVFLGTTTSGVSGGAGGNLTIQY